MSDNLNYKKLGWDSNFFGFNVGFLSGNLETKEANINLNNILANHSPRLIYYSSLTPLKEKTILQFTDYNIKLVDEKTIFSKAIDSSLFLDSNVQVLNESSPFKDKLIDLSIQSGIYSRFNIDDNIDNEKFIELYKEWLINSLNKKIAKVVLGYVIEDEIAGFVTVGEKNNKADVGIIAVDFNFRGKGIGKMLMKSAEKWSYDNGYKEIQVVTQGNNNPASKLYKSCNYSVEYIHYFYHFWSKIN